MARLARVVAPGVPHHVTQRGNRRQPVFFTADDYQSYRQLMAEWCAKYRVEIWAYCLMPNHVHLIAVPETEDALARAIGEAHRRYTRLVNFREGWRGHLWQGRFASYPLEGSYLANATRYVELNPVRARLASEAWQYRWSSTSAHISGHDDGLVRVKPLLEMFGDWREFLSTGVSETELSELRQHSRTGRPLGSLAFLARLERILGRVLVPKKAGRKSVKVSKLRKRQSR